MYAGAVFVPVNPKSSEAELAGLIEQVGPRVVLGDAEIAQLAEAQPTTATPSGPAHPDDPAILIRPRAPPVARSS